MSTAASLLAAVAIAGIVTGLGLLVRGLRAHRTAARISGVGTSPIGLVAAGEVRITGEVVAAGVTLTSRLRRRSSVYYRALVRARDNRRSSTVVDERRAIGFFVRDATGEVRVFPRAATWEVPLDTPTSEADGAEWSSGARLLLSADPGTDPLHPGRSSAAGFAMPALVGMSGDGLAERRVRYQEASVAPGEIVTVVGRAIPFRDLADPAEADASVDDMLTLTGAVDENHVPDPGALRDPVVAEAYARALREGIVLADPASAWGNAAIEGFGIGRPVRPPQLDPEVPGAAPVAADASASVPALDAEPAWTPGIRPSTLPPGVIRDFEIPPDRLVMASGPDAPLIIAAGTPGAAFQRSDARFMSGLLGAALAAGSALLLALTISGALGPITFP